MTFFTSGREVNSLSSNKTNAVHCSSCALTIHTIAYEPRKSGEPLMPGASCCSKRGDTI